MERSIQDVSMRKQSRIILENCGVSCMVVMWNHAKTAHFPCFCDRRCYENEVSAMTPKANIIWQTDEQLIHEDDIARNIEVRHDADTGYIEIRVIKQTERDDTISLAKSLTPLVAIDLGITLIDAVRNCIEIDARLNSEERR